MGARVKPEQGNARVWNYAHVPRRVASTRNRPVAYWTPACAGVTETALEDGSRSPPRKRGPEGLATPFWVPAGAGTSGRRAVDPIGLRDPPQSRATHMAMPMPPPMHRVARPFFESRF